MKFHILSKPGIRHGECSNHESWPKHFNSVSRSAGPSVVVLFATKASNHHHQRQPRACSKLANINTRHPTPTTPTSSITHTHSPFLYPVQPSATMVRRTSTLISDTMTSSTIMVLMVLTTMVMTTNAFSVHHIHSRTTLTNRRTDTKILAASRSSSSSSSSSSSQPRRRPRKGTPHQGGYQNGNTYNRRQENNNGNNRNHRRGPRDPRVAKWIATNRQILDCHHGSEVLSVLSSTPNALTKMAGGGALSVVNIATSIHRISRSASTDRRERQAILSDPRYALLLCSATEALIGMDCSKPLSTLKDDAVEINNNNSPVTFDFSPRELANIAWALAKMEILPPASSFPLYRDTIGSHRDM